MGTFGFFELIERLSLLGVLGIAYSLVSAWTMRLPLRRRSVAMGILFGVAVLFSMLYPLRPGPGFIIDARTVVVALAAAFAGPLAGTIAAGVAAAYRVWLGGIGVVSALPALALSLALGCLIGWLGRRQGGLKHRHLLLLAAALSVLSVSTYLILPWANDFLQQVALPLVGVRFLGTLFLGSLLLAEDRRRSAEKSLAAGEAQLRLFADNATDMIVCIGTDGVRRYVSPASREVVGYAPEELVGQSAWELMHPEDRDPVREKLRADFESAGRTVVNYRLMAKDGRAVPVEARLRLVRDPKTGEKVEIIGVVRDVSRRKAVEDQLVVARDEAERANRAKSEFFAGLSHELRTPLSAVIGFADLMAHETMGPLGNPKYLAYAQDIRASGQHLLELINEILDNAKAEAGRLDLHESEVDLAAAVEFTVRLLAPRAERAGVELTSHLAFKARIAADERRLKQVLLNLAMNAIKYTPAGGRISISAGREASGDLVIEVRDNGIGIPERDLETVLEPFRQVDEPHHRREGGTGLGLPITKRLVELHGGTLTLTSREGLGTTVTVRLPGSRVVAARPEAAEAADADARRSVLVVDDDEMIVDLAALWIEDMGFEALRARNANEALALLRDGARIDLLFSDVVMPPGMSGIELARQAISQRPALKVLLTSGFAGHAVGHGEGSGGFRVIAKPYSAAGLAKEIHAILGLPANGTIAALAPQSARVGR